MKFKQTGFSSLLVFTRVGDNKLKNTRMKPWVSGDDELEGASIRSSIYHWLNLVPINCPSRLFTIKNLERELEGTEQPLNDELSASIVHFPDLFCPSE